MEMLSPLGLGSWILAAVLVTVTLKMIDSKAGRTLVLLLLVASFGWRSLLRKTQNRPYQSANAANIAAAQTINEQGRIAVRAAGAEADLFQRFQANGASNKRIASTIIGKSFSRISQACFRKIAANSRS